MTHRTQKVTFLAILINLAVLGVVGYALDCCRQPVGALFLTKGGPVAFSHQAHVLHGGEDLQCKSCHHDIKGKENLEKKCRDCHYYGKDPHRNEKEKIHKRCIGAKCVSCHADKKCIYCHSQ